MRAELVIDGKQVTLDGGWYPVINPATEEVVGEAAEASEDQVRQAAAAARAAWAGWRDLPVGTRTRLVTGPAVAPSGGFGASGLGPDGGLFGLEAYTEPQSIIKAG